MASVCLAHLADWLDSPEAAGLQIDVDSIVEIAGFM